MTEAARKFLSPAECLSMLPVRMAMREFRRRAIDLDVSDRTFLVSECLRPIPR